MMPWLATVIALLPAFAVPAFVALHAGVGSRMAAVQLAGCIAAFLLAAMSFAFDQSSFIDLALCLALVSIPSTFLIALFMERWL